MGRKRPHHGRKDRGNATGTRRKPQALLSGVIRIARPGIATVKTPEGSFAVARGGIHEAMDGDEVQAGLVRRGGSEPMVVVRSVLQRAVSSFVGTYEPIGPLGAVKPLDGRIAHDFFVLPGDDCARRLSVADGDVVEARILQYPGRREAGVVTLDRRVGATADLDLLVEAIIASHGLATEFGEEALQQAAGLTLDVGGALTQDPARRDLRDTVTLTVDPTDARDYDDAVSARRLGDGAFEVGVHIADVASYLPWGSPMDVEARQRTCSVYLVDRVLPMLPERLCNDLCSLRPHEDRLSVSVILTLDAHGTVLASEAVPSAIRSHARLDYATADALLAGTLAAHDLPCQRADAPAVADAIRTLDEVAALRRALRARRGAVDFETREAKMVLDDDGHAVDVVVRERTRATGLIEEAMLMANEAVAKMLDDAGVPAAYRAHEQPSPERLSATLPLLRDLRLLEPGDAERLAAADPYAMQDVLERAKGTPGEVLANALLLRAQKRATYLPHNVGHFALGASAYCHFTSPIRRYPDVVAHRALKALLAGRLDTEEQRSIRAALPQLCRTCSDGERAADAAGLESQEAKMAELYEGRIGMRCSGIVVGCERYGLFVMLDDTCAEGMVPTSSLDDEWFAYDERRMALTGEESGRTYTLGQRVVVEVTGANPARGQIDLALAQGR